MNELLSNVLTRKSIYQFDSRQIIGDELCDILEAGQFVSDAIQIQNWHFLVIQNTEVLDRIRELWKNELSNNRTMQNSISMATTLIIVSSQKDDVDAINAANATIGNMMLAGERKGIGSCWLPFMQSLFQIEAGRKLKQDLNIPEDYIYSTALAIGYKANPHKQEVLKHNCIVNFIR